MTRRNRDRFDFSSTGKLTAQRDLDGNTTSITYPTSTSTVVTDPGGRTLTFTYTGTRITSLSDSASPARTMSFTYDGSGNLTEVVDVAGGHWQFGYDGSHRMTTMREPRYYGDTTTTPTPVLTNHYDAAGRVDWQSDPLGRTTSFDYTTVPGTTIITDPRGNKSADAYVQSVRLSHTEGYGTASPSSWTYGYDPYSVALREVTDPNGHKTTSTFNTVGDRLSVTDALGHTTTWTYNSLHDVTSVTPPTGVTTTFTYDTAGHLLTTSTPWTQGPPNTNRVVTNTYGDTSHPDDVTSVTDPRGKTWTFTYDAAGNRTSSADPVGNTTRTCYDAVGRTTAVISPRGSFQSVTCSTTAPAAFTTYFTADAFGRVLSSTNPLGHASSRTFDGNGNLATETDADSRTTTHTYNAANELVSTQRPDSSTLAQDYWPDGRLRTQYDGAGQPTSYDYDARGRLVTVTDPRGRITTYGYDDAGNRTTKQDPSGDCGANPKTGCTTSTYDNADRLTGVTYSDGVTPNVTYTYDAADRRTQMTDGSGTSTYSYDSLGRLTSTTNGASQAVGFGYDLAGNRTTITYPGSNTVTYAYDDAGRMSSVTDWSSRTTTFTYDRDSNLTGQAYPNSVTATSAYNNAGELTSITDTLSASTLASFTYTRTNSGLVGSLTPTGVTQGNETYAYNPLRQLTGTGNATFGYDKADNLTLTGAGGRQGFDQANQLCWSAVLPGTGCDAPPAGPTTTYGYDGRGNRTSTTVPAVASSVYAAAVGTDSPAGYWRLGETSGTTAADASGNGRTGTYLNGVSLGAGGALGGAGDVDRAASFDGVDDRVTIADTAALRLNGNFSVEFWAKRGTNSGFPGLMLKGSSWTADGYSIWYSTTGTLSFKRNNVEVTTTADALRADVYRHFVVTYDGSTVRWYVDGVQNSSASVTYPTNAGTSSLKLGTGDQAGQQSLDEVAVYNSALSATRVAAHFTAGVTLPTSYTQAVTAQSPLGYWRLGDAVGAPYSYDWSGNARNATYVGSPSGLGKPSALAADGNASAAFDGVDDDAKVPDSSALRLNGNFSIEFWAKRGTNSGFPGLMVKGSSWTANGYLIWYTPSGTLSFKRNNVEATTTAGVLRDDAFRHFVITYDGTTLRWYVDGTLNSSTSVTYPTNAGTNSLHIGLGDQAGIQWLDEVAVYGSTLTGAQVLGHYTAGVTVTSPYTQSVLSNTPVAYWRLGERPVAAGGAGPAIAHDSSGAARSGVYSGGVTVGAAGALVDANGAARFDGVDDKVEVPDDSALRLNGSFTVEFWAKRASASAAGGVLVKGTSSGASGYAVSYTTAGTLSFKRNNVEKTTSSGVLRSDRYRHFAVTYDDTTLRWYVDGVLDTSSSVAYPTNSGTSVLKLGQGDLLGNVWLDDVAVYSSALTATQLVAHVNAASTAATAPAGSTTTSYGYDQANRLKTVGSSVSYAYNGDGLRTSKTVSGSTASLLWDVASGLPLMLESAGVRYVYGPGGAVIAQIDSGGTALYYHQDHLGSTRVLTNGSGSVVATYTYDAYGSVTAKTGTATTPFGFTGQYTDTETGFVYLRARYYDPATGQFLTRDPLSPITGTPYAYVDGNPLNMIDPSGECGEPPNFIGPTLPCQPPWSPVWVTRARVPMQGGLDATVADGGKSIRVVINDFTFLPGSFIVELGNERRVVPSSGLAQNSVVFGAVFGREHCRLTIDWTSPFQNPIPGPVVLPTYVASVQTREYVPTMLRNPKAR